MKARTRVGGVVRWAVLMLTTAVAMAQSGGQAVRWAPDSICRACSSRWLNGSFLEGIKVGGITVWASSHHSDEVITADLIIQNDDSRRIDVLPSKFTMQLFAGDE